MEQMLDMSFKPLQSPLQLVDEQNKLKQQAFENQRTRQADMFNHIDQVSSLASKMVQAMVSSAAQRQLNQGLQTLAAPEVKPIPQMGGSVGLPTGPVGSPTTDANGDMTAAPLNANSDAVAQDQQNRKQAAFNIAKQLAPKDLGMALLKQQFPQLANKAGQKNFQQSQIQVKGPDGRMRTVVVGYDQSTNQYLNPLTGQQVTSESQLLDLPERGYAQTLRPAGYTADGKEVVADQRSGEKFVVGKDTQGNETYDSYNGKIYPKLDNVPAGITEALGELNYSGEVLKEIGKTFDPAFVGPIAARAGKMSQYVGALTDEQKVQFYGNVAEYKNSIIKAITGAQMSEVEAKRIVQQIPNENASPTAFVAGLKRAYQMTQRRITAKRDALASGGYAMRSDQMAPMTAEDLNQLFDQKLGGLKSGPTSSNSTSISPQVLQQLQSISARIQELKQKAGQQ